MKNLAVLRIRKGAPGVGRRLAKHFNAQEVTCGYKPVPKLKSGTVVLNYGRSPFPVWYNYPGLEFINRPEAVALCVDKRKSLKTLAMSNVSCLNSTTSRHIAQQLLDKGRRIIVRHLVKSKQGKGVELFEPGQTLPEAPLYTEHFDKTHEYRVHVFDGKVIDRTQKKKMGSKKLTKWGLDQANHVVRNHKRGWIFAHKDIIFHNSMDQMAIDACASLGLDYGGVDILAKWTPGGKFLEAVVCEVNSAPGMSSTPTFKAYCEAIKQRL